jgi:gamma-glutamyltranspeptidase
MRGLTTSIRFQRTIVATTYSSPSGRGLAAMMMLNVLSGYDVGGMTDADRIHVFAEASKQTNLYRNKLFGDPSVEDVPVDYLLPADWHERARTRIDLSRAQPAVFRSPKPHKDTIYLCVVDVDGSLSLINSLFEPFGSGILAPDSGVILNNRGYSFNLEAGHPNCIAPRKRPMNTIVPGMLMREGKMVAPFGAMGPLARRYFAAAANCGNTRDRLRSNCRSSSQMMQAACAAGVGAYWVSKVMQMNASITIVS